MNENPKDPAGAKKDIKKRFTFVKTFNIAVEFGFIIVVPLLALGYLGKYLDHRYGHENLFTLLGILLSLLITSLWFYRTIKKLIKDMKDQE